MILLRQLAVMLDAGLPPVQALEIVRKYSPRVVSAEIDQMLSDLRSGAMLADTLAGRARLLGHALDQGELLAVETDVELAAVLLQAADRV